MREKTKPAAVTRLSNFWNRRSRTSSRNAVRVLALIAALVSINPAHAEQCVGRLVYEHGDLTITDPYGGDGVCIVGKGNEQRVLSACPIGRLCTVTGTAKLCGDSVECVKFTRVTDAHR
jgi:hypothetical protein